MPRPLPTALLLIAPLALAAAPAAAQSVARSGISAEVTTDYRQRGLSWSDSDPALRADGTIALGSNTSIEAGVATLRGSNRHGGSDLGITISPRYSIFAAGLDLSAGVTGHLFAGADDRLGSMDYFEIDGRAAATLGPGQLAVRAAFAPSQDPIGGSNLYLNADLSVGLPGSPLTAYAGGGYTHGASNGDLRRTRLRPDGDYTDWYLGLEHSRGPLAIGVVYSDTSIDNQDTATSPYLDRGTGARASGYVRISL